MVFPNVTRGAKIFDAATGETVGTILSEPFPGTNLLIGLMRLEQVGLLKSGDDNGAGGWSHQSSKVKIGDAEFRYLPYLPLWWPELDMATGKAKRDDDANDNAYDNDEARPAGGGGGHDDELLSTSSSTTDDTDTPSGMNRIEIEELPLETRSHRRRPVPLLDHNRITGVLLRATQPQQQTTRKTRIRTFILSMQRD
jgi:hypothetical protein